MDKLILKKQKKRSNDNMYRIRVSGEVFELVEELSEKTNLSMTEIASKLISFAAERTEIQGGEA